MFVRLRDPERAHNSNERTGVPAQVLSSNYTAALTRLHYDVTSAALGTRNCTPGCAAPQARVVPELRS